VALGVGSAMYVIDSKAFVDFSFLSLSVSADIIGLSGLCGELTPPAGELSSRLLKMVVPTIFDSVPRHPDVPLAYCRCTDLGSKANGADRIR